MKFKKGAKFGARKAESIPAMWSLGGISPPLFGAAALLPDGMIVNTEKPAYPAGSPDRQRPH